ncbi:MAG: hypothetical protein GX596_10810, partial [Propionibacterium sp.]|nr:hypothetical protein [Propionibacterium sp.]
MTGAAAAAGGSVALGVLLLVAGLRRTERATGATRRGSASNAWGRLSRVRKVWIVGSVLAGVAIAAVTGFLLAIVLVPALTIGVPYLLSAPASREVDLLAALDRWVRLLSTT